MRALVIDGGLRYEAAHEEPQLTGDQVRVRITSAGICNTDLELLAGYMKFSGIPGHEFVGVAETGAWAGKRVVGEINVSCGACDLCQRGLRSQCRHRTTVGMANHSGAFADLMALTAFNLHEVPDNVSDEEAVFVEPLAAALQVLECVRTRPSDRVIVLGAGKLGLLVAQVLALNGADVSVLARRDRARALLNGWGIPAISLDDLESGVAPLVVECTGKPEGFALAQDLVIPRGTIVLKSTYTSRAEVNLTRVAVDEVQVIGNRCGPFEPALRLLARRLVDVQSMIEARYPLEQGLEAFKHAAQPGVLKVLVNIGR